MTIDKVLRKPIEAGLIPGIVAVAGDDRGNHLHGHFQTAGGRQARTYDARLGVSHCVNDEDVISTAVMQLVERGRIGLEQPTGNLLPVIRDAKVWEGSMKTVRHVSAILKLRLRHLRARR
jgi:hypothetical protein